MGKPENYGFQRKRAGVGVELKGSSNIISIDKVKIQSTLASQEAPHPPFESFIDRKNPTCGRRVFIRQFTATV